MQRDLVERAMAGDQEAFSELMRLSLARLYAAARLILRDDAKAQDATQEALVSAWRHIHALRDPDRFEAWLHRALVRACHHEARRERRWQVLGSHVRPLEGFEADASSDLANQDQLARGVALLKPDERTVLVLHYYLDRSFSEMSLILGQPEGTVKARVHRANQALRAALAADARSTISERRLA
jgi:RNA polymerase sigma-70 factor (ECF subfamily)